MTNLKENQLNQAANEAIKTISDAAATSIKVVAESAAEAVKLKAIETNIDAISLAKLGTDVSYLIKLTDSLNDKMDNLPNNYTSSKDFSELKNQYETANLDLVKKVENLQMYLYMGLGIVSAGTLLLKFFVK